MLHAEIEIKFCVPDPREFHARALRSGFALRTPRTLERNALFDTPDRRLLSFYKERVETETEVEDGDAMGAVFIELGYAPVFRYEKFRTEFHDGEGALVLDETPIGDFAELEGTPDWIDHALERLSIDRAWCFTDSYGRMFLDWKARSGSPAENMTFDEIAPAVAV